VGRIIHDDGGATDSILQGFGVPTPPPPPPTAPPTAGGTGAPTVGSKPGQGVVLTAAGGLPTTLANSILQLVSSGQHKIAMGSGALSFSAAATADGVVTHGLGSTPIVVLACANLDGLNLWYCSAFGATALQFTVRGVCTSGAVTATPTYWWLAIS
jgi:hypothetical protein